MMGVISAFPGGGGAGGAALNVTAYTAAGNLPASADTGAVGVITATAIGDVYASAVQPASPVSGDIWLEIAYHGNTVIALTDKISLHTRAVYQYSGSAWVIKTAYIWVTSSWVQVFSYLYNNGTETMSFSYVSGTSSVFTKQSTYFSFNVNGELYAYVITDVSVNLTNYTYLKCRYSKPYAHYFELYATATRQHNPPRTGLSITTTGTGVITVNVSALNGNYYIGFLAMFYNGTGGTTTISEVWLE